LLFSWNFWIDKIDIITGKLVLLVGTSSQCSYTTKKFPPKIGEEPFFYMLKILKPGEEPKISKNRTVNDLIHDDYCAHAVRWIEL
jgi:hypothetical protein